MAILNGDGAKLFDEVSEALTKIVELNADGAKKASDEGDAIYEIPPRCTALAASFCVS